MTQSFIQRDIFRTYREKLLLCFADVGKPVRFARRQPIELSGQAADCVYLICAGCVKQYFDSPQGVCKTLLLLSAGDIFNEVTLLHGDNNCVVSFAQTEVTLLQIPSTDFWARVEADPRIYKYLTYELAYKLRLTMAQVYDLSFGSAAERLRALLLRLCVQMGEETPGGVRIPERFTHEDYAQMITASRSTLTRLFREFAQRGYIRVQNRYIVVCPALEKAEITFIPDRIPPA